MQQKGKRMLVGNRKSVLIIKDARGNAGPLFFDRGVQAFLAWNSMAFSWHFETSELQDDC